MSGCPSEADLFGFLNQSLPPKEIGEVSAHVDACASCQGRLDTLTHDNDGAIARYKELSSFAPTEGSKAISSPDVGTLVVGMQPLPPVRMMGLPSIPGFDVLAEIGRGGMGVVYKARHRRLNRAVALKMILAGSAADARVVQRFLFEAEILARVQHPQVVQVFEVDTYVGTHGIPIPYLAMELLEGGSLSSRLRKERLAPSAGEAAAVGKLAPLEPRAAAELIEGIARAVHCAHAQGVIHRDLKPANILFPRDEPAARTADAKKASGRDRSVERSECGSDWHSALPKVSDFGLAKFTQDVGADVTGSGQVVGTPHYMAPEQAAGSRQIGPTADVYALGAILFECLTGRTPFEGDDPMSVLLKVVNESPPDVRSFRPGLHRDLAAVAMRCLSKEPRRRYASALELAEDLRRFLELKPTIARPVSMRERAWLWTKRNPAVAGLAVALFSVMVTAFIAVTAFWMRAEQTARDERSAKDRANEAERRANGSREEAAAALEEARRQKSNADRHRTSLEFASAASSCEEGRVAEGLESFIRTVELAESVGDVEISRVARVNIAAWLEELPSDRTSLALPYSPRDIAFFPDGRRAAIGCRGATLIQWDIASNRKMLSHRTSYKFSRLNGVGLTLSFSFWTVAVSPDGKTIAAGGSDGQVWIWDADKAEPKATLHAAPPTEDVWAVAFAPDGSLWATDGGTGVRRWNLTSNRSEAEVAIPPGPDALVQSLALSSDGLHLYTGDRRGIVQEWDAAKRQPLRSWNAAGWVSALALSPGGDQLAATGNDGYVRVIDLVAGVEVQKLSLSGAYGKGVAFSPVRPLVLASDADGNVRGWNCKTGVPVGIPLRLSGEVLNPRFVPKSDDFVVPAGNAIRCGRLAAGNGKLLFATDEGRIRGLDYSPRGDRLAIAHERRVVEFDLAAGTSVRSPQLSSHSLAIRYDPNSNRHRLIRGFREGFESLDLPSLVADSTQGNAQRASVLAFTPDGSLMFALDGEKVTSWNPNSFARSVARYRDANMTSGQELMAVCVRPDGRELAIAYSNEIVFLDAKTLTKSRPGWQVGDDVLGVRYLSGGGRLFVGRRDSVAQVLDAASGTSIGRPMTHKLSVLALGASPDEKVLLTGSRDGTARFWDAATSLPLGPPLRHSGQVGQVEYNPDGTQVATGAGSGEVSMWTPPPPPAQGSPEELRTLCRKRPQ